MSAMQSYIFYRLLFIVSLCIGAYGLRAESNLQLFGFFIAGWATAKMD